MPQTMQRVHHLWHDIKIRRYETILLVKQAGNVQCCEVIRRRFCAAHQLGGAVLAEQNLCGAQTAIVVITHGEAVRTGVMNDEQIANINLRQFAVDSELIAVLTQRAGHIIGMIARCMLLAQHRDVMVCTIDSRTHQIGSTSVYTNVMLIGVLTVFGHGSHGATRWFKIGPIQLQPSEFLKLALILLVAKLVAANKERLNSIKFLALIACLTLFPILLVAMQPNLSTTILLCLIIIAMLYCAGVSYKIFGIAILIAVPVISAFLIYVVSVEHPILIEDYQRKRIVDFIEGNKSEEVDMTDAGTYQQAYAVQAIGSGQLYGKGLNNNDTSSLKNAGYIAEAQNDFIFAVIGEELGFTGSCITIFLLFLIVLECIITAVRARNFEGRLICCGVAIYIGFQTFINIGVVSWILPNTGVPLPFFSCGITSLLTLFIAMGIVLNVSLQRNVERDDDMFADDFRG